MDKIVGPGNAYVQEAKRQVFGEVSIDMIAGPSEILIVADKTASARVTAADLLSQAEHDRNSSAVLVTDFKHRAHEHLHHTRLAVGRELQHGQRGRSAQNGRAEQL